MKKKIGFLAIILIGLLAFSSCAFISMQFKFNKAYENAGIDFSNKESILRLEKDSSLFWLWRKWKPIENLLVKEEKKLVKNILKIQDAEERNFYQEKFIEYFWKRRDTNLYDENPSDFKETFYDRVIKAQTRYGNRNSVYDRKCKYGTGWQTDMGLIYILLGDPDYPKERYDYGFLMSHDGGYYQESALIPQEVEVWYYDVPFDEYYGGLFQGGVAWILFEKDSAGYWAYGSTTVSSFYNYENYQMSYIMGGLGLTYSTYMGEINQLLKAFARENIYDEDLKYEDMLVEWVKIDKKKEGK